MANNTYVNKVEYGNDTLMDITDTTAEVGDVLEGLVFYAKSGARSVGTLSDATLSTHGLMSAADKTKLDNFSAASNYMTQCVIPFGYIDSSSTSTVFTATVPNVTELVDGLAVYITNNIVDATSIFTLNVNNLGAKEVCWSDAATLRVSTTFKKNQTYLFIYNSSRLTNGSWDLYKGYDSDKNDLACNITSKNAFGILKNNLTSQNIIFTTMDGKLLAAHTTNSTGTNKTLITESFDPYGPIYVYPYTITFNANTSPLEGTLSIMKTLDNGFDLRYAFNTGSTLTIKTPVYIKCSPQSDGSVKLAGNNCIVLALPSTADGYVYIFLGKAISTTNIDFDILHPVYEYRNGAIRSWTNADIISSNATTTSSGLMSAADKTKLDGITGGAAVTDVLINSTSILSNGVANIPYASLSNPGVVRIGAGTGIDMYGDENPVLKGMLKLSLADDYAIKSGNNARPFGTVNQHKAVFYGLTKAAGVDMASSDNAVGTYTDEAKAAIQAMLGVPSINDLPNMSLYATISNPIFTNSISMGRKDGTTTGDNSFAVGHNVEASGRFAYAEGGNTRSTASGAHAEGMNTLASGSASHAGGSNTIANGLSMFTIGRYNYEVLLYSDWTANTSYDVDDKVKMNTVFGEQGYKCILANSDSSFQSNKWLSIASTSDAVFIVGNGESANNRSNALTLNWDGTLFLNGDVYVNCNNDSSGGVKLVKETDVPFEYGTGTGSMKQKSFTMSVGNTIQSFTNVSSGAGSVAFGFENNSTATGSFAEGLYNTASGSGTHVEGRYNTASGSFSHVEGLRNLASSSYSHVLGLYNVEDTNSIYADIVGNGSSSARSNAFALSWDGNGRYAGDVYVNCNADSSGGTKVATIEDVESVEVEVIRL